MIDVLVGLGLLLAVPQGNAQPATAAVQGYVREAGSHAPIPHARVTLTGPGVRESITADNEGRFGVAGLVTGRYMLAAEMEGFAFDAAAAPFAMLVSGQTVAVDIEMPRAAVIAGEVRDEFGNPRSGLQMTAIRKPATGGTELPRLIPALTNDLGEFRADGLLPGEYLLLASPPAGRTRGTAVMPTYYPGVTEQKQATSITVTPGQTASGIRITMQPVPAFDISGTVVDEQGRPRRALIAFVSQSIQTWVPGQSAGLRAQVTALVTRADGTFRITGLGPGSYRLTPMPAPAAPPQQMPMEVMTAGLTGNGSTLQVDVRDADVSGVTIVFRTAR